MWQFNSCSRIYPDSIFDFSYSRSFVPYLSPSSSHEPLFCFSQVSPFRTVTPSGTTVDPTNRSSHPSSGSLHKHIQCVGRFPYPRPQFWGRSRIQNQFETVEGLTDLLPPRKKINQQGLPHGKTLHARTSPLKEVFTLSTTYIPTVTSPSGPSEYLSPDRRDSSSPVVVRRLLVPCHLPVVQSLRPPQWWAMIRNPSSSPCVV